MAGASSESGGGAGSPTVPVDLDFRLYHKVGGVWKRKTMPPVTSADFELPERGGMGSGSLSLPVTWEDAPFLGTEFVDIWIFEVLMYRGFVKIASHEMNPNETASPTLQSLVERMNHYPCLWSYAYGGVGADLSVIAGDLITDANNLFSDTIATDLDVLDITLNQFDPRGKSVPQALNSLCDYAPNQAIWGVQASWSGGSPVNTVYFRPKPTTTGKYYSIGEHVTAFVYPKDTGSIINAIKIEGGPVKQPNLCFNPSFEEVGPASETVGNLLLDYSFEDNDPAWTLTGSRKFTGMDATAVGSPKDGKYWLELDNSGESGVQVVLAPYTVIYTGTAWVRREGAAATAVKLTLEGLNAADTVVVTADTGFVTPAGKNWEKISVDLDPTAQNTVVKIRYRVETNGGSASNDGVLVDFTALVEKNGEGAVGWRRIVNGVANASTFQWNYKPAVDAFHGGYVVRSDPSAIAGASDYVEIRVTKDKRIEVSPNERYSLLVWFYVVDPADVALGIIEYDSSGTNVATNVSDTSTLTVVGWQTVQFYTSGSADGPGLTLNANTRSVELLVRHKDNDEVLIDAVFFCRGDFPEELDIGVLSSGEYWPGENYERVRRVTDSDLAAGLSAEAETSITDYGERMEVVSEPLVIDETSGREFAEGYFNESAIPAIMANLTVDGLKEASELLVITDGKVKIVNLPDGPDALSPARVNYTFQGDRINMTADLGAEHPTMEGLLRHVQGREGLRAL